MSGEGDGSLDVTVPVKAGSRMVGATFLATNYRPSLDMIKQYDRKSLENNSIPQLQYYPAIGFLRIQGPFTAQRPTDSRSIRKVFTCRPANGQPGRGRAPETILSTLTRRAYRRPATARGSGGVDDLLRGRPPRRHVRGRHRAGASAPAGEPAVSRARRKGTGQSAAGSSLSHQRSGTGFSFVVLPVEQHSRRRADQPGQPGKAEQPDGARATGAAHARRSSIRRLVGNFAAPVAVLAESAGDLAGWRVLSRLGRRAAAEFPARDGTVLRKHHAGGSQRRRSVDRGLHVPQRAARQALRHPQYLRIPFPPRDARAGTGLPSRTAGQGKLSVGHLDAEFQDVTRQARRVGPRKHPRHTAAGASAERSGAGGRGRRVGKDSDVARADDAAPEE